MLGKTFIITGASSGIGRAVAILLSELGGSVIALGRDQNRLEKTLIGMSGSGHHLVAGDISTADGASDLLQSSRSKVEKVDGIFHAAGISTIRLARMTKSSHIDQIMGASLLGALGIARAAGGRNFFSEDGGSIVLVSSVAGERGQIGMSTYGASRAALLGLTKNLACEFAEKKVRVNCIVAGAVETEMHEEKSGAMSEATLSAYRKKHLLGFGKADDIANCAAFLLSDASRWITGASWPVDGGFMAK